ncbi:uncharacterized protein LOC113549285 [Rhopalosiphum maidis]|uniref:uncharacterized protein LOC113549285 n=1 Tax=Rhopalosiphum maidis TaxID=43146 RepID=UPI000EFDF2ED|nr:uncharacterized protein LOC113549285 [Rhopalosiphum maidis]
MKTDNKVVLIFLSFLAVARCTDLEPLTSSDEENRLEPTAGVGNSDPHPETGAAESTTAAAAVVDGHRSARQFYRPSAAFAYQPYPQRRAYNKSPGQSKKRPSKFRTKPGGGRRGLRPRRRPSGPPFMSGPPSMPSATGSRYRRLPAPAQVLRPQHVNYIDTAGGGADYDDGFESAPLPMSSFDYGDMREFDNESGNYVYGPPLQAAAAGGRSRKRPVAAVGYADETRPTAIVHVPVRVVRPVVPTPPTAVDVGTTADPMEKLKQLVHEAMDEHFASRHQELYGDGFGKQQQQQQNMHQMQQVYSAKYKRQPSAAADREKSVHHNHQQQRSADAVGPASASVTPTQPPSDKTTKDVDVDADGSDDRLTLAEISAYMGAKPAETVLSAGGHRYVLSDALQQSYRHQQQQHRQLEHHHQQQQYGGEDHQPQYLRYVSPFEALYELPAARWTYK